MLATSGGQRRHDGLGTNPAKDTRRTSLSLSLSLCEVLFSYSFRETGENDHSTQLLIVLLFTTINHSFELVPFNSYATSLRIQFFIMKRWLATIVMLSFASRGDALREAPDGSGTWSALYGINALMHYFCIKTQCASMTALATEIVWITAATAGTASTGTTAAPVSAAIVCRD